MSTASRILVIIGTPLADTLVHALAASYIDGARESGADVRVIDLAQDPIPAHPQSRGELRMPRDEHDIALPADVSRYLDALIWSDHVAFFYPQWWGTYPAALKAFIDRVFLSGAAFRYHASGRGWDRLLAGRTARIVMTMDSPGFWNRLVYRNASETSLHRAVLGYCGIRVKDVTRFSEVRHRSDAERRSWLPTVRAAGARDAASVAPRPREDECAPAAQLD